MKIFALCLLIIIGLWEFLKLSCVKNIEKFIHHDLPKLKSYKHEKGKKPSDEIAGIMVRVFLLLVIELSEAACIIFCAVIFPAPLKWFIFSTFVLAFVTSGVTRAFKLNLFSRIWRRLDYTYCITVYLVLPIFLGGF